MLSTGAMRHYMTVVEKRGISLQEVMAGTRFTPAQLHDPYGLISHSQYRLVVQNILRLTGDRGIAFDLASLPHIGSFGAISHALMTCRTVRDAHNIWLRYGMALFGNLGYMRIIEETRKTIILALVDHSPDDPLFRFCFEECSASLRAMGSPMTGEPPAFVKMSLSYAAPTYHKRYAELFDCPIQFDARYSKIVIPRDWLESPIPTHDEELNSICLRYCDKILRRIEGGQSLTSRLQKLFVQRIQMRTPLPDFDDACRLLKFNARTFRRRLQEEGTNYRTLINHFRTEQAKEYLSCGSLSSKALSHILGFKEPSAFFHAFKDWTGQSVQEFRARQRSVDSQNSGV